MSDVIRGFREFEFDLPSALLDQLVAMLDSMESENLELESVGRIPNAQGVYQLFYKNELVYIGKTDAQAGLRPRLERHAKKIIHRIGISPNDITFKSVQILVFSAMDLETALIRKYETKGHSSFWNNSGFGANDPGRNRDTSKIKSGHFDAKFPIDIDTNLQLNLPDSGSASEYLSLLRSAVPYILRFERAEGKVRSPHADLEKTVLQLPRENQTTRNIITKIVSTLPTGWQATKLPGYLILYRENKTYVHGEIIKRS